VKPTIVYVRERGRVPDCWVPADAVPVREGVYRITRLIDGRQLEFGPGDLVRCETRGFPDGSEALLALERAAA
jgi:hypothetical protein